MSIKKRVNPTYRLKVRLLQETGGKCPFCLFNDLGRLEFHHIDEDSSNTVFKNLIAVCPNCHSSINEKVIALEDVQLAKQRLGLTNQLFLHGKYQFTDFSIRENRVSIFTKGMTIDDVYRILPKEQVIKTVGYGEHPGEDTFDEYLIYDFDGTLILTLIPENDGTFSTLIKSINIKSEKLAAINGTRIGSTIKDVNTQQMLSNFSPDIEHILFRIDWLNATCSINKKNLTRQWWNEEKCCIDVENIDETAKIQSIYINW